MPSYSLYQRAKTAILKVAERKKHKDWFDLELAHLLADKIESVYPAFDRNLFLQAIQSGTPHLEIKDRVEFFADQLYDRLPAAYDRALKILLQILGAENPNETGMFTEFYWVMPIAKFVEKYGLDHFGISMRALAEITKRNTSEYAIRPYLEKYPIRALGQMTRWSKHKNFHIRRLASEGVRPRLPWASKLDAYIEDPTPILPILENLKDDPIKFVQKSVANCINDILKDNYSIGIQLLSSWSRKSSPANKWIIKHALRTELKKGTLEAQGLIK